MDALTPARLAEGITDAMATLEVYTRNAEALARDMAGEDAIKAASALLEREAAEARKAAAAQRKQSAVVGIVASSAR